MAFEQYNQYPALTQARVVAATNQSGTYFNGPTNSGVDATFTYSAGALTIDSVAVNQGDRVLFAAQSAQYQNGVYVCINPGASGIAAILQRASSMQSIEQLKAGQYISIGAGSTYGGSIWTLVEPLPAAFGNPAVSDANNIVFSNVAVEDAGPYLLVANNLSDVQSAATSATNLGLGTGSSVVFTNLNLGASGTAGLLKVYSATGSKGYLELQAVANTGNTATIINNAAMGQASTISIPDPGQSTANFLLSAGTSQAVAGGLAVTGNSSVTSGYFSLGVSAKTASVTQTQVGATPLTTQISNVTVTNASDAIVLPAVSAVGVGGYLVAINNGATAGTVYGNGSDTINGTAGSSGSVAFAASKTTIYYAVATGTWLTGNVA